MALLLTRRVFRRGQGNLRRLCDSIRAGWVPLALIWKGLSESLVPRCGNGPRISELVFTPDLLLQATGGQDFQIAIRNFQRRLVELS